MNSKPDTVILRELIEAARVEKRKQPSAWLVEPGTHLPASQFGHALRTKLHNGVNTWYNENVWIVEDWSTLKWRGEYFFHRGLGTIYLVKGTKRDFNNSVYRSRLQGFQEMVSWASSQPVGFTLDKEIEEVWGHLLVNPWLISSVENRWYQRIKLFAALNEFDSRRWPMSLLITKWERVRKILF